MGEEWSWLIVPVFIFGATLVATVWLVIRKQRFVAFLVGTGLLLLLATAIPSLKPSRFEAWRNICISNLQQIEKIKASWAASASATNGAGVTWENLVGTNALLRRIPECPAHGSYALGLVGEPPACSLDQKGQRLPATPMAQLSP
jgi:hypothetical protein